MLDKILYFVGSNFLDRYVQSLLVRSYNLMELKLNSDFFVDCKIGGAVDVEIVLSCGVAFVLGFVASICYTR